MAPTDPTDTARMYLDYSAAGHPHQLLCRFREADRTHAQVMGSIAAFLTDLDSILSVLTVIGIRVADQGEHHTYPVIWTGESTYGSGGLDANQYPREVRWQGRGIDGVKMSVGIYGLAITTPGTFRTTIQVDTPYADALTTLQNATALGAFVSASGSACNFKAYVNVNYNSYWETHSRG